MTIQHFFILAFYSLWAYILLCMFVTVLANCFRRSRKTRQKKKITSFFSPWLSQTSRPRQLKRMLLLSRDDELFDYMCFCYCSSRENYDSVSGSAMKDTMQLIFHRRIQKASRESALTRCLLVRNIQRCGMDSDQIRSFLRSCSKATALEQFWAQSCEKEPQT